MEEVEAGKGGNKGSITTKFPRMLGASLQAALEAAVAAAAPAECSHKARQGVWDIHSNNSAGERTRPSAVASGRHGPKTTVHLVA